MLKVILSRKGFDSCAGGHASPILPDGKMLSLPIPKDKDTLRYDEIAAPDGKTYGGIIDELAAGARIAGMGAHLDPDLVRGARPRLEGWRPALGHTKASTHLQKEGVSVGDLFLFYGWFRHTEEGDDGLRFRRGNKGYHVIFGYLQIGEILTAPAHSDLPTWLRDHPHAVSSRVANDKNTIYVAMQKLSLHPNYPGAGIFQFDKQNVLTKEGLSRSRWNLDPELFQNVRISCHSQTAWRDEFFQSNRGQEFVIDANKPIVAWASRLIRNSRLWELD
ncbi:MAG: hypothetical protein QF449_09255 [Alphaproteobacteria bacterium]|nr:hypothetical protein [Alphaproteobacteria bacterium]MDP6589269.1 hypothetical protein [Alphaproteobacteria bacterium]MDP6818214.1 hypothetical protein [Alphaproteobacteria bacterium]